MVRRILDDTAEALLTDERRLLARLRASLAQFGATERDLAPLDRSIEQLDELFLLVVAGEFNAGKSAFINALLGKRVLAEGVTPTTAGIHVLRWGEAESRESRDQTHEEITAPLPLLREVAIVDTPGTNAIHREHEALTREFIPRADLVLFVTSADRPFTESERSFLEGIRQWGKKIVVAINKIDILETEEEVDRVIAFVAEGAKQLLGTTPEIFPVAAREALRAKVALDEGGSGTDARTDAQRQLEASRFPALESYIVDTLDAAERLRLKLSNPLGVGRRLAGAHLESAEGRLEVLADDIRTLEDIDRQLGAYRDDMEREFRFRLADVDNLLHQLEARGTEFFDETLRLGRIFDLLDKSKIRSQFERQVIGDLPRQIEARVTELIDWLVAAELAQWEAVTQHAARRREHHADRIVGEVGGRFDYDRDRLLATLGRSARATVEGYDQEVESRRMAESVQRAVASTALLEAGAVGLGATIGMVATSAAVDVTGIIAASALAAVGLFVIPNRRRVAKRELSERIAELRKELMGGLESQFRREMDTSLQRLRAAIAPYTRFVRSEQEHLTEHRDSLRDLQGELDRLAARVEALGGGAPLPAPPPAEAGPAAEATSSSSKT